MSKIEWTEKTWNPVVGCTKISPGCKHCYAEVMSKRLRAMGTPGYEKEFKNVVTLPDRLSEPMKRGKPTMYFVNSMSDLFHEKVLMAYLDKVFNVIQQCPQHTFQILTKRAARMEEYFRWVDTPDNAWLGVSVENKNTARHRIYCLKRTPAKVRFLSVEPLLEDLGELDLDGIQWVIVGGESGAKARPMKESWALNVQRQCKAQNVPFFFKQWGTYGHDGVRRSKKANGRLLSGKTWDAMPVTI